MEKYYFPQGALNKPAKLYKCFSFNKNEDLDKQFSNFMTYETFRWFFESEITKGQYQITSSVVVEADKFLIRTNTLSEIKTGDFIELDHPVLKDRFFTVISSPIIDGVYCPKYRQTFQHLTIQSIKKE